MIKKNKHPIFKETPFARREKNLASDDSSEEEKVPVQIEDARIAKIKRIIEA